MEIDQKNGSILTIILPGRFEKHINSIKIRHFFRTIFLKNVFFQIHFTYCSGRASGRLYIYIYILLSHNDNSGSPRLLFGSFLDSLYFGLDYLNLYGDTLDPSEPFPRCTYFHAHTSRLGVRTPLLL